MAFSLTHTRFRVDLHGTRLARWSFKGGPAYWQREGVLYPDHVEPALADPLIEELLKEDKAAGGGGPDAAPAA